MCGIRTICYVIATGVCSELIVSNDYVNNHKIVLLGIWTDADCMTNVNQRNYIIIRLASYTCSLGTPRQHDLILHWFNPIGWHVIGLGKE